MAGPVKEMYEDRELHDVVLSASDVSVATHQVILTAASQHLRGLFRAKMANSKAVEVGVVAARRMSRWRGAGSKKKRVCVGGHPVYRAFLRGLSTNMRSGIFKKMSATLNLRGKILQTETMCTLDATQPELCLNTITTNHIYQQHQ